MSWLQQPRRFPWLNAVRCKAVGRVGLRPRPVPGRVCRPASGSELTGPACALVRVPVVRIWDMRMRMNHGFMYMGMAVCSYRHRVVRVIVMAVIVAMRVLMFQPLVRMFMVVRFRQVQYHPQHHQQPTDCHHPCATTVA